LFNVSANLAAPAIKPVAVKAAIGQDRVLAILIYGFYNSGLSHEPSAALLTAIIRVLAIGSKGLI
jgi:hypothetical protein